jgi:UDP-N-acetylmuramate: L-alanyl-gamma-D-glutamyl-meso-diaminopimelate ligase
MNIHILGICGTLMGSIALLARELGHQVTGTDENVYPPMSTQLENAGIKLSTGYTAECIPAGTELVIVGNANLPRGNPALETVMNRGITYTSGAEWLGRYLLADRWVIAVAGTHGKTTTTSMISWILEYAGLNPGFLIGGIPQNFEQSSRLGADPFFVIEADEYDTSYFDRRSKFLHYRPRTLVMNNLEFDHADIFKNLDAIKAQFHLLLRSVPSEGLVIHPDDDANLQDVIAQGCWTSTLIVGGEQLHAVLHSEDGSKFSVVLEGQTKGDVSWPMTGNHNISNALSAIAAARHVGVSPEVACEALSAFTGVKRRMELIHSELTQSKPGLHIYDDFAHHPTAIDTTLAGLRNKVGGERILAIIEPASHTMKLGIHESTLASSARHADQTIWFQPASVKWDMQKLSEGDMSLASDIEELVRTVAQEITTRRSNLHVVIMSNGSFSGFHTQLIERISA